MNLVDRLLKIDLGQIETPKTVKKMYLKKLKQEFDFECVAVDPERISEIYMDATEMKGSDFENIKMFEVKAFTIADGCEIFKDKKLMDHFKAYNPLDLVKVLMTGGEIDELFNTIQGLSAYSEAKEDEVKN